MSNSPFQSNRRGTLVWLLAMVVALLAFLNAGALTLAVGLAALTVLWLVVGTLADVLSPVAWRDRLLDALPFNRSHTTEAARSATLHARQRPDYDPARFRLGDIGLVIEEPREDGLHLRQARLISMDDEAVRPYAVVYVPRQGFPRQTLVRYEIADAAGQVQFVCEMDRWLRPGENLLLPDYRLPLKGNAQLNRVGTWDLHIWINGGLLAVHHFSVSPSVAERRRQFGIDGEAQVPVELEKEAAPLSLDELLAQQRSRTSRSGSR